MTEDEAKTQSADTPWSGADLFELRSSLARGDLVEETAALLKRSRDEVHQKIKELRLEERIGRPAHERRAGPEIADQSAAAIELAYRDTVVHRARQRRGAQWTLLPASIVLGAAFLVGVTLAMIV
jgi:hypothetical protein